jgi:hypothetical protein
VQAREKSEENEPGDAKDKEAANLWVPLCPCSSVQGQECGIPRREEEADNLWVLPSPLQRSALRSEPAHSTKDCNLRI